MHRSIYVLSILVFLSPILSANSDTPCKRTKFQTESYKEACEKGGQKAAKKFAKKFLNEVKKKKNAPKDPEALNNKQNRISLEEGKKKPALGIHRISNCNSCHSTLSPNYELKPNALELFKEAGGK